MTVEQVAGELGLSVQLVYKLCQHGKLGHHRFGFGRGRITVDRAQLDAYKRACEVLAGALPDEALPRRVRRGPAIPDVIGEIKRAKDRRRARG